MIFYDSLWWNVALWYSMTRLWPSHMTFYDSYMINYCILPWCIFPWTHDQTLYFPIIRVFEAYDSVYDILWFVMILAVILAPCYSVIQFLKSCNQVYPYFHVACFHVFPWFPGWNFPCGCVMSRTVSNFCIPPYPVTLLTVSTLRTVQLDFLSEISRPGFLGPLTPGSINLPFFCVRESVVWFVWLECV
jgi:hypothetical protein